MGGKYCLYEQRIAAVVSIPDADIAVVSHEPIPAKDAKALKKRLGAVAGLYIDKKDMVIDGAGHAVNAIASWRGVLSVQISERERRFRLLAVDRFEQRTLYAAPVELLDKHWQLPDIPFSDAELRLLKQVADEISDPKAQREHRIALVHPARDIIRQQLNRWTEPLQTDALLDLLRARPWLLPVCAAALDTQLRSFKRMPDAPLGLYNFTIAVGDTQGDHALLAALGAMNFTVAEDFIGTAPIEIIVRDAASLQDWHGCYDRVVLIRTATGSLLTPLLDEIDERERARHLGGNLPARLSTVPIVRCKVVLNRRNTVDIELPKNESPLSGGEQDLLRSWFAGLLNKRVASAVYDAWRLTMSSPSAYRLDGFTTWRESISRIALRRTFQATPLWAQAEALLAQTQAAQQAAEEAREQAIARAVALLSNPQQFAHEIIDRPADKTTARCSLDTDETAVAFWFKPGKGEDKRKTFLAFTPSSFQRLLNRVSCDASLRDAVLDRCERSNLLDDKNRSIKLHDGTINAITICAEKL